MTRSILSLIPLVLACTRIVNAAAFDVPMDDLLSRQEATSSISSTLNATSTSSASSSTSTSNSTAAAASSTPGFVNNGTVGTYPCALPQGYYQDNSTRLTGNAVASSQLSYSPDSVPGGDCSEAQPPVYPYNAIRIRSPDDSIRATFLPYGAALSELWVKDRFGGWRDIVLGFDNKTNYGTDPIHPNFGPTVGRYANRIKNGTFSIDGKQYQIPKNENGFDSLHGGDIGYDRRSWSLSNLNDSSVSFTLNDPAGFQGFPGEVNTTVTHSLANDATWNLKMNALASEKTPILLSSHVYWNLEAYNETQSMLDYVFHLPKADKYIETDSILVPTGPIPNVNGTAYDFQTAKPFNELFNETQGICGAGCQGWDSCWVMSEHERTEPVIEMYSTKSGIKLSVTSDQPAIQAYTCDGISSAKGNLPRKRAHGGDGTLNKFYDNHSCVVLEMEGYIDGINHPEWNQDQIYDPSRPYVWESEYKFSTVDENGKAIQQGSDPTTSSSSISATATATSVASSSTAVATSSA